MHRPTLEHYEAGLAVLSYLHHAKDIGLHYDSRFTTLEVFKDTTWNRHPLDYCGHAIMFCGAAISFGSKLIKLASQSSGEAEIYAYVHAAKDLRFVQQVLEFLGVALHLPTPIYTDSTTAESWIKNPGATARSRHYEKFLMYAREQYLNKVSHPQWISGQRQIADVLTKALDKTSFLRFRDALLGLAALRR